MPAEAGPELTQVSIYLPVETAERLTRVAAENYRSFSAEARRLLEAALDEAETKASAA